MLLHTAISVSYLFLNLPLTGSVLYKYNKKFGICVKRKDRVFIIGLTMSLGRGFFFSIVGPSFHGIFVSTGKKGVVFLFQDLYSLPDFIIEKKFLRRMDRTIFKMLTCTWTVAG